ncbi:tellurium resistance protein TerC [bacterium]|nr:tellurium resistance protein TerC [bacterium]
MADLFTLDNLVSLFLLILLQAVLGFDNLLYISLESKNAPVERQSYVRKMGIGIAVVLRILLLLALTRLIAYVNVSIIDFKYEGIAEGHFNLHSIIVLVGGIFILYTAVREILHMMSDYDLEVGVDKKKKSTARVIMWIVLMNLVFSFDSILSAMALTDVFAVMATAIVIGGLLMIWLADAVSTFLQKNRMYEVLGLFILFVVGIMLLTEGGHLAHLHLFGNPIEQMSKTTFYFVIGVLVFTDIVQSRYQKKLLKKKEAQSRASKSSNNV